MRNLNKKGFFMTETLMVIVFVTVIFTFLYISVIPLIGEYHDKTVRESDIDIVYKLYSIRKAINEDNNKNIMMNGEYNNIKCDSFSNSSYCNQLMDILELNNYSLIYSDSISNLYTGINNGIYNVDDEVKEYLKDYKDILENAIILLDKNKHTISHLEYIDPDMPLGDFIKYKARKKRCNTIWVDNMGTGDTSDDVTYLSGTNSCVDFNYVWYSGKLWRILAIYPDGSLKMITEDAIAGVLWGSSIEYNGSWMYQWLNEDFYDTLVNPDEILLTSSWNYASSADPRSDVTPKIVSAKVGLLNSYEYRNSYRNSSSSSNYLKNGYSWYLLTPYIYSNASHEYIMDVTHTGSTDSYLPYSNSRGVRPSIVMNAEVDYTGKGTNTKPFRIVGDKEGAVGGVELSSRSSGEYVRFDGELYRIVEVDETSGITKLTKSDYLKDSGGNTILKKISSTKFYGSNNNIQNDDYFDYYLNHTWYENISSIYKNMMVDGIFYLGDFGYNYHYKRTICKNVSNNTTVKTANCKKYTSSDANKTFTGKVGLPRIGEMFSAQLRGTSTASDMWVISPQYFAPPTARINFVYNVGVFSYDSTGSKTSAVRPSIYIKSGVKIIGGTGYVGGETYSPFEIGY